ncbi:MFS transporter [Roseomonas sp. CCTCC AB2023176]|uniref:MFS transporter n=1 Tax=Roseomonas sp. CCTCC AB2023176 TaxID=3342640 RepID=UPI0035DDA5DF
MRIVRPITFRPTIFQPLGRPPVALLWAGLTLSAVGDQLYAVALTWIATEVFGPAAGYLTALQAATVLLFVTFAGDLADRLDRMRAMLGADLVRAAALLALVGLWLVQGAPTAVGLAAVVVVLAIGQAVFQPALQSVLPALVQDPRLLPAANGLFDGTERSARLLGPGLLALLAGTVPLVHFLTLDAVTFLVSAAALGAILRRYAPPRVVPSALAGVRGLRRGVRAMRAHPLLGYVLVGAAPLNGAWTAVFFLGLPLLLRESGADAATYGLLIAAYGASNLLSNIVVGSLGMPERPGRRMFGSSVLVGCGMACFAVVPWLPGEWQVAGYVVISLVTGVAGPMKDIPVAVLRQARVPVPDIPAATRASLAASSVGVLAAMLLVPTLLRWVPVAPVVFGCGLVAAAVGAVGLLLHRDWREPALTEA